MNKQLMITPVVLFLAACGAAEDAASEPFAAAEGGAEERILVEGDVLAEADVELGTLEQELGEPACGTNPVNRAVNFTGGGAVRFLVPPPYGSASCANAFLTGLSSITPHNGTVHIFTTVDLPQATCSQAQLRSDYYVGGARVVPPLSSPGVFRNGRCEVGTSYNYNTLRTVNSVAGTQALLAGGTRPAAANARFAAQLVVSGQIRQFIWDIIP
jgi:hypothetical protein